MRGPFQARVKSKITKNNFIISLPSLNLPLFFLYQLSADLLPPVIQTFQLFLQHLGICLWWLLDNLFTSYIQSFDNSLLLPNAILKLLQNTQHIHIFIRKLSMKKCFITYWKDEKRWRLLLFSEFQIKNPRWVDIRTPHYFVESTFQYISAAFYPLQYCCLLESIK